MQNYKYKFNLTNFESRIFLENVGTYTIDSPKYLKR